MPSTSSQRTHRRGPPDDEAAFPLLAAGLAPAVSANSLWARIVRGLDERAFSGRAAASLTVFRDLIVSLTEIARAGFRVDRDRQDAGPQRLPPGPARGTQRRRRGADREPRRAGVGRARVREPRARTLAGRLRRPPVAALRRRRRARNPRRPHLADDAPQRQGTRVPDGHPGRPRGRSLSAFPLERGRGGARGRTPALLRRHDPRARAARADRRGATADLRRVPGERAVAVHRRSARRNWSSGSSRRTPRRRTRATSRTTSSGPTRTAAADAGGRARNRRPTRTRTKISQPGWRCARA